jgi:hypothetical protein
MQIHWGLDFPHFLAPLLAWDEIIIEEFDFFPLPASRFPLPASRLEEFWVLSF